MESNRRLHLKGITAAVLAAVILIVWVYGSFDPSDPDIGRFFPKCILKMLTGLDCPSCGMQRSLHSLINGDFVGALRCNWFVIFSLSYLLGVLLTGWFCAPGSRLRRIVRGRTIALIYVALYFAWFVVRNILGI